MTNEKKVLRGFGHSPLTTPLLALGMLAGLTVIINRLPPVQARQLADPPVSLAENRDNSGGSAAAGDGDYGSEVLGLEFVAVPGGCFMMGDSVGDGYPDEQPVHEVCLTPFRMAKYPVSVSQFRLFVEDTGYRTDAEKGGGCFSAGTHGQWAWHFLGNWRNPGFEQTGRHPAVCLSWDDAFAFAGWLSRREGKTFRLPTEAEWEYAARAGTNGRNYWGNEKDTACRYANVSDLTVKNLFPAKEVHNCADGYIYTAPVGSYLPNGFGLYDMMGNVWQWTGDWYQENYYRDSPKNDPQGPSSGRRHVPRGGSWRSRPEYVRASMRVHPPAGQTAGVSFRLVSPGP